MAVAILIALVLALYFIVTGRSWLALVSLIGPLAAWLVSILGGSAMVITTFLSGGGTIPVVAGIAFLIIIALGIMSFIVN